MFSIRDVIWFWARLLRLSVLGMTVSLPVLGLVSAAGSPTVIGVAVVISVAAMFHITSFLVNDAVDLEIDRDEPRRSDFPLVTGAVSRSLAISVAVLLVPIALVLDVSVLGVKADRITALVTAHVGMFIYNLFGKRCPLPPATDFTQGTGLGALVLYGALSGGGASAATLVTACYVGVYFAMITGVHGALRDVRNDIQHGARTTAIMLGARQIGSDVKVPIRLRVYAWVLQGSLLALVMISPLLGLVRRSSDWIILATVVVPATISVRLLILTLRRLADPIELRRTGAAHVLASFAPAAGLAAFGSSLGSGVLVLAIFIGPAIGNVWYRACFVWMAKWRG